MANEGESVLGGGFQLDIEPGEFVVSASRSARKLDGMTAPTKAVISRILVLLVLVFGPLMLLMSTWPPEPKTLRWVCAVLWLAVVAASVVWAVFSGDNNVRCTQEALEVIHMVRGRVRLTRSFLRREVKDIRYVVPDLPLLGPPPCLTFVAAGRRIRCLSGLSCYQAERILAEFRRMGFAAASEKE